VEEGQIADEAHQVHHHIGSYATDATENEADPPEHRQAATSRAQADLRAFRA